MSFPKKESDSSTNSIKDDQIRRTQLQIQFHGIRREDFQTIEAYVKKLKSIADSLTEIGDQISDSDMVLQLLAGLPNEYLPLMKTISSMFPLPNFEEACSMLHMQEDILLQDPSVVGAEQWSDFFTIDKLGDAVDTLGTIFAAQRTVRTVLTAAGTLGLGGAVGAVGAAGTVSAVAGWKIYQTLSHAFESKKKN